MSRTLAALTIALTAMLGLTACTGAPAVTVPSLSADEPGDEGQSKADACALIQQSIDDAADEVQNISSDDPAAVVGSMNEAAQRIADAAEQVTNDEVAALVPSLQEMFAEAGAAMDAFLKGDVSKVDEISGLGAKFQETSEAFQELCSP